jgi:hypothetical protein
MYVKKRRETSKFQTFAFKLSVFRTDPRPSDHHYYDTTNTLALAITMSPAVQQ